jgi:hypothetical protein
MSRAQWVLLNLALVRLRTVLLENEGLYENFVNR